MMHLLLRLLHASQGLSLLVQPFTGSLPGPPEAGFVSIGRLALEDQLPVFHRVEMSGWMISALQKFIFVVQGEHERSRGDRGIKVSFGCHLSFSEDQQKRHRISKFKVKLNNQRC